MGDDFYTAEQAFIDDQYEDMKSEIDRLKDEIKAARAEHERLRDHALKSKLILDDRTMSHTNDMAGLRSYIEHLEAALAEARGEYDLESEDIDICELQVLLARQVLQEWDGQSDADLVELLSVKFGRPLQPTT